MKVYTPSGEATTGRRGGRKTPEALARLHSGGSLNRSHAFTAEGRGSSLAPTGRRSFAAGMANALLPEMKMKVFVTVFCSLLSGTRRLCSARQRCGSPTA